MKQSAIERVVPLAPIQHGLLFHVLAEPDAGLYTEHAICELAGPLDRAAFQQAWSLLVARHTALRSAVLWKGLEQPVQVVYGDVPFEMAFDDLTNANDAARSAWMDARIRAGAAIGRELGTPPLMRLALAATAPDRHQAVWSIHHLIHDAWSLSILLNELLTVYAALARGQAPRLPPAGSFADFVLWRKRNYSARDAESFWRTELANCPTPPPWPERTVRTEADAWARIAQTVDEATAAALESTGRSHGLTPNTLLLGAWTLALARAQGSGADADGDVLFGTAVSGRPVAYPGIERTVGVFINTLPFRARVDDDDGVAAWLRGLQRRQQRMLPYESTPLAELRAWADVTRDRPLFESIFVCQNALESFRGARMGDLEIADVSSTGRPHYPLMCRVTPGRPLLVEIVSDTRRIAPGVAGALLDDIRTVLDGFAVSLDTPLTDLMRVLQAPRHAPRPRADTRGRLSAVRPKPAAVVGRPSEEVG